LKGEQLEVAVHDNYRRHTRIHINGQLTIVFILILTNFMH